LLEVAVKRYHLQASDECDVLQQVWLEVSKKVDAQANGARPVQRWSGWLMQVLANKVKDLIREKQRHPAVPLENESEPGREALCIGDDLAAALERDDMYEQVLGVIAGLRGREDDLNFQILLMRHVEGQSTEEVAALLDLSREAVADRLRRAVEKVRRALDCGRCEGT
jgi:RNA polymerase sigma factor (sigma-70 family)